MNDKFVAGYIPEKIKYVFSIELPFQIGTNWDKNKIIKGYQSFIIDSNKSKSFNSAAKKALLLAKYNASNMTTALYDEKENSSISNVKILHIANNGSGALSYKGLIDNKYIVDLKDDLILDSALKNGIKKGGILKGEYIWGVVNNTMRLIRVGSELHKLLLEFSVRKKIKPILHEELKIGDIYQNLSKQKYIFIGKANTTILDKKISVMDYKYLANFKYDKIKLKDQLVFLYLPKHTNYKSFNSLKPLLVESFLVKKHKLIEKVGNIKLPNNILEVIRELAIKDVKQYILNFTEKSTQPLKISSSFLEYKISNISPLLHLYKASDPEPNLFDPNKYLAFM